MIERQDAPRADPGNWVDFLSPALEPVDPARQIGIRDDGAKHGLVAFDERANSHGVIGRRDEPIHPIAPALLDPPEPVGLLATPLLLLPLTSRAFGLFALLPERQSDVNETDH